MACGGRAVERSEATTAGSGSVAQAGSSTQSSGASSSAGSSSGADSVGSSAGQGIIGGSASDPGAGAPNEAGASSTPACLTAEDCPALNEPCRYATCESGACLVRSSAAGTFVMRDVPADCWAQVCDGQGGQTKVVDVDNVPVPLSDCNVSSCSATGIVESAPVEAGGVCASNGGKLCDGSGHCLACLADTDCELGEACSAGQCVASSCKDGFRDQAETDVDCGGPCPPCATGKDCGLDADCASGACDALAPHRCLADHCQDHHRSADETDVDCGGSCRKCEAGFCKVNADCVSNVCDADRGFLCLSPRCVDGMLDGTETDLDCGGGICDGCALGQTCVATWDCASRACNAVTRVCVADHCTDFALDGDETSKDCGGPTCAPCGVGALCQVNSDCQAGLTCQHFNPHVCL